MTTLSTAKTMLTVSTIMIAILVVVLVVIVVLWIRAEMRVKWAMKARNTWVLAKNSSVAASSGETKEGGGTGKSQKAHNFYFTYGTTPEYPFCGGWTLIVAKDWDTAERVFRAFHRGESYAFAYSQKDMEKTGMLVNGNAGAFCHEKIVIDEQTRASGFKV